MTISQREEEGKGLLPLIFSLPQKHFFLPLCVIFLNFSLNKTEETDRQTEELVLPLLQK